MFALSLAATFGSHILIQESVFNDDGNASLDSRAGSLLHTEH
jgi:hypothetical protein